MVLCFLLLTVFVALPAVVPSASAPVAEFYPYSFDCTGDIGASWTSSGCHIHDHQAYHLNVSAAGLVIGVISNETCVPAPIQAAEVGCEKCVALPEGHGSVRLSCVILTSTSLESMASSTVNPVAIWQQWGGSGLQSLYSPFPGAEYGHVDPTFSFTLQYVYAYVVGLDGTVYLVGIWYGEGAVLLAVDGQSGAVQWSVNLGSLASGTESSVSPVVAGNGVIAVALLLSQGFGKPPVSTMVGYSARDGSVAWTLNFGTQDTINTKLICDDLGHLYFGVGVDSYVCVDSATGSQLWQSQVPLFPGELSLAAASTTGDLYLASSWHPHNDDDDVYLYTFQVAVLSGASGHVTNLTTMSVSDAVSFFMISPFDDSLVIAQNQPASNSSQLNVLTSYVVSGSVVTAKWNVTVPAIAVEPSSAAIAGDGTVLVLATAVTSPSLLLIALSGETGTTLWAHPTYNVQTTGNVESCGILTSSNGLVYVCLCFSAVATPNQQILAYKVATGELVFNVTTPSTGSSLGVVVGDGGSLFTASVTANGLNNTLVRIV